MKKEELFNIIGEVDEQKVAVAGMAMNTNKKSRPVWVKWGAMAACLCLVVVGALTIPNLQNETPHGQGTMEQVYTLPQAETMSVKLIEWSVDHFKGVVVDAGDNSIFPADAELSVVFDYDTEILLDDGTVMVFNPDEPDTDAIGWKEGTIVTVTFVNYDEYREGNHFYNHAYASYVEVANEHKIVLQYNEVSSVMSSAPALAEEIVKVKTDITEISELLGYDIDSCIPSAMKSYDFKYYTVTNTDTNEILSVAVDAREVGEETSRPGIRLEVGFGTRPLIDYDFYEEETVYSTINGVEVCATFVPEITRTNASGKEKTTPAVYTATFEQGENYYYIESRGALEQVIFD